MRPAKPRQGGCNQERAPGKDRNIPFRQKSAIHCSGPENNGWSNFCLFDKVSERLLSARRAGSSTIKFSLIHRSRSMIITRSPLRISLGGGGTDLPSYYREHGGFLIAAAIDKYVYINVHRRFVDGFLLKYSHLEEAATIEEIKHPIIREALKLAGVQERNLEITSMADIPAGTGLGSSGSFTTALLKAFHALRKNLVHPAELAEQACQIELEKLHEPIGKQDQYIAAFGGITCFKFLPDGQVEAWPLKIAEETLYNLEDNLLLFFTGYSRSASTILKEQDDKSKQADKAMTENLHFVKELGQKSQAALESSDLPEFARLMDVHWQRKKERSQIMSNQDINAWYDCAMANGALGGKLIGAGSGGFLMFYTQDKARLRHAMREKGLKEVRFRFDFEGTKILNQ
jgi:D-glycero-alpha-D-manno-heptose-7-phosphate kinase